jgi:CYTH domain-containing protein
MTLENNVIVEMERKFLLKGVPRLDGKKISISQFYMDGIRYRKTYDYNTEKSTYEHIKKVKVSKGVNHEIDVTEITRDEYDKFYYIFKTKPKNEQRLIVKRRLIIEFENKKFEIDMFYFQSLILLEVEGVTVDEAINFPPEIKKLILMEVTGNPAFDNYSLAEQ